MSHAEAHAENVVQIGVELLDLLNVSILESDCHIVGQLINLAMDHLLDHVFASFCGALPHFSKDLVLAVLSQSSQLVLEID